MSNLGTHMVGRRSQALIPSLLPKLPSQELVGSMALPFPIMSAFQCLVKCCQMMLTRNTGKIMIDFFWPLAQTPVQHHSFLFKMCGCSETVNAALKIHTLCHQSNLCTAKSCVNLIS